LETVIYLSTMALGGAAAVIGGAAAAGRGASLAPPALIPPDQLPFSWLPEEQCGRAWGMQRTGAPSQPSLLVVSVGGVGTTTTMEELDLIPQISPLINSKYDRDGLKHAPFSRLVSEHACHLARVERILYLWGEPSHAVESLYRRHFQFDQAIKTRTTPFEVRGEEQGLWQASARRKVAAP